MQTIKSPSNKRGGRTYQDWREPALGMAPKNERSQAQPSFSRASSRAGFNSPWRVVPGRPAKLDHRKRMVAMAAYRPGRNNLLLADWYSITRRNIIISAGINLSGALSDRARHCFLLGFSHWWPAVSYRRRNRHNIGWFYGKCEKLTCYNNGILQ